MPPKKHSKKLSRKSMKSTKGGAAPTGRITGIAVDPSDPSITDGTSNTIMIAEKRP